MDGLTLDIDAPIPGSRIGEDPKYDDRYVALKDEIAKLDALTAKSVDFALIERLSVTVLTSLAKDLLACTYLAYARYRQHGVRGLADGLGVLHTFLGAYGRECFPARPRARANAVTWLVEAVVRDLGDRALDANDYAAARDAREMCARVGAATRAVLGDDAPSVGTLEQALERIALTAGDAPPPVASPPAFSAPEPSLGEAVAAPAPAVEQPHAAETPFEPIASGSAPAAPAPAPEPIVEKRAVTLADVAASFLDPIDGPSPAGAEAKFDPSHEAVCAELAKLSAVTGAVPDYARVITLAEQLLKEKSKDLLIASYLGVALFERDGVRGLPLAIALPAALLERFDADLHPMGPRLRRRSNALSFLYDRLAQRLPDVTLTRADAAVLDDVITLAKQHARVVLMAFESDGPATRTLTEAVDRLALSLPEPEPEPVVAPPAPATVAAAPSPEPTPSVPAAPVPQAAPAAAQAVSLEMPSVPVADVAELGPFLADVGRSLVTAANALRGVDAADPRAARLLRTGLYLHIEAAPPHGPDGKTSVPPPPDALYERLAKMAEHAKWAAILDETEASLGQFRFSLDLHRYSALALRGLGREDARAALVDSLRPFLARVPKLVELSFANGRPFADADTVRFLKKELSGGKASRDDDASAESVSEVAARFEEAASQGVLEDVLAHGEAMIAEATGGSARFHARLRVATALADAGHGKAARALHEALDHDVRVHGLELWDPDLVLSHLVAFAAVLAGLGAADALERLTSRVAAISPRALSTCLR